MRGVRVPAAPRAHVCVCTPSYRSSVVATFGPAIVVRVDVATVAFGSVCAGECAVVQAACVVQGVVVCLCRAARTVP